MNSIQICNWICYGQTYAILPPCFTRIGQYDIEVPKTFLFYHGQNWERITHFGLNFLPEVKKVYQWRIQEFQNRGRGPGAVELLGCGDCFDAPSHKPLYCYTSFFTHL